QIQYKGEAKRFSWIVPVQALPDVQVGSEALFDRLLAVTVPTFGFQTQFDTCNDSMFRGGFSTGSTGGGGDTSLTVAPGANGGVSVVLQKTVGAFDVTVLEGSQAKDVKTWLETNGYQVPPGADRLFAPYLAQGYLFVAVKLTGGAGIDEI